MPLAPLRRRGRLAAAPVQDTPLLVVLDRMMPGLDGAEVCRRLRARSTRLPTYVILLTCRDRQAGHHRRLRSGADDYVTKPFDIEELVARSRGPSGPRGARTACGARRWPFTRHRRHAADLLALCSYCKRTRVEADRWLPLEEFLLERFGTQCSHGICPACFATFVKPELDEMEER